MTDPVDMYIDAQTPSLQRVVAYQLTVLVLSFYQDNAVGYAGFGSVCFINWIILITGCTDLIDFFLCENTKLLC